MKYAMVIRKQTYGSVGVAHGIFTRKNSFLKALTK